MSPRPPTPETATAALRLDLPEAFLEALAERLAPRVAATVTAAAPDNWLGVEEAAAYISAPASRIYDLKSRGEVEFRKDGARLLFRRAWLDEYLERSR